MQEESYVLLHCNCSGTVPARQYLLSPFLHPALRDLKTSRDQRRATVIQNQSPSLLRSNSAPKRSCHKNPHSPVGFCRMNSSSGGSKESIKANVDSQNPQSRDYRHHHHNQQRQHNRQLQHNHLHNGYIFRNSHGERFAYTGLSTAFSTYNTYWTSTYSGSGANSVTDLQPAVHIPALDLTAITLDDGEHDSINTSVINERRISNVKPTEKDESSHFKENNLMAEENAVNKRQKKSQFVFPCEKSLADFDGVKTNPPHIVYEDPASVSPFAQRGRSLSFENSPILEVNNFQNKQPYSQLHNMQKRNKNQELRQEGTVAATSDSQKIIHFSLANPKVGKYILDEESSSTSTLSSPDDLKEPQRTRESIAEVSKLSDVQYSIDSPKNEGFVRRASDAAHNVQEILDVVVVDGHLHVNADAKEHNKEESDTIIETFNLGNIDTEIFKEKSKPRVTFSFDHEIQSCRSLKRYTPVKMDVRPLHGVLKKRPEPTQVLDLTDSDCFEGSKQSYFSDSNAAFRKSSKPDSVDQGGIRVKHLHTTNFDISREAGKRGSNIPSTMQIAEKPPIPVSRRVALAAAESSVTDIRNDINSNNNNNLLFTGGLTYICSNAQGRMAYFRPADLTSDTKDMSNGPNNMKVKSRSTEDVNRGDAARLFSKAPTFNNQNISVANCKANSRVSAISSPYTLRRSVSTDHGFAAAGSRVRPAGSEVSNTKPAKPRVAFGSFIVPKETTPRVKKAHVKYHEVESANRPMLSTSGKYVHTHTRRASPYSPPTQVLFDRSGSSSGPSGFRRPYTAQVAKATRVQKAGSTRTYYKDSHGLVQRHSAPSSFNTVKDRAWRVSMARQKISINNSPSQGGETGTKDQQGRSSDSAGNFLLPTKTRPQQASSGIQAPPGGAQMPSGKLTSSTERLGVRTLSRPDLSALNMLANRDKGLSQTHFLATLNKTQNRE